MLNYAKLTTPPSTKRPTMKDGRINIIFLPNLYSRYAYYLIINVYFILFQISIITFSMSINIRHVIPERVSDYI